MIDYSDMELELLKTVGISKRPVAVTFRNDPPHGVPKFAGKVPSGCSFFSIASGGMTFYTIAADHHGCAIGAHSFNLQLHPNHKKNLAESIATLGDVCSIDAGKVQAVPRTEQSPEVVIFSPLGETPLDPDLVVLVVRPQQGMLLQEAAIRRQIEVHVAPLSQPTCLNLHKVLINKAVTSAGCLGNRVYNALGDDEMYMLLPGRLLKTVTDEVQSIATSNHRLALEYLMKRESMETLFE